MFWYVHMTAGAHGDQSHRILRGARVISGCEPRYVDAVN